MTGQLLRLGAERPIRPRMGLLKRMAEVDLDLTPTVDLAAWCAHLRRNLPLLAVFNDTFLLRLIERPLEALELDGGDGRRMQAIIADADNFPTRSFTMDGSIAIRHAVELTRAAGITSEQLVRFRGGV